MKWHNHCHYMEIPRDYSVEELAKFHGHLGPFIVIGYRIGKFALHKLGENPFIINAEVFCSGVTPQSCLADGVQIGSGCTLGKGNIEVIKSDKVFCNFSAGDVHLKCTPYPFETLDQNDPDYEVKIELYSESLYSLPDEELFKVESL